MSSTRKIRFQRQSKKQVTYYTNGQITMAENITIEKM